METTKTKTTPTTIAKPENDRSAVDCAPCTPPTGGGAATGRNAGAAIGGAIGHVVGAGADIVAGAVAGGIAAMKDPIAKAPSKAIDPTIEHAFWRGEFKTRPYFTPGTPYEQYSPAFQYGWQSFTKNKGKTFNDVEPQLGRDWESRRGQSKLSWTHAKGATHDAWKRAEKADCGDTAC